MSMNSPVIEVVAISFRALRRAKSRLIATCPNIRSRSGSLNSLAEIFSVSYYGAVPKPALPPLEF